MYLFSYLYSFFDVDGHQHVQTTDVMQPFQVKQLICLLTTLRKIQLFQFI